MDEPCQGFAQAGNRYPLFGSSSLLRPVELAFLGDALVGLAFALDPVEILVSFGRQQLDDLEASARARSAVGPRGVRHRLADRVLVTRHRRSPFHRNTQYRRSPCRRHLSGILFHINTIAGIAPIVSEGWRYHGIGLTRGTAGFLTRSSDDFNRGEQTCGSSSGSSSGCCSQSAPPTSSIP